MRSAISASPSPRATRRSSDCSAAPRATTDQIPADNLHKPTRIRLQCPARMSGHHGQHQMISRRHFLRLVAGLGASGVSTVAYGFGVEPSLRLGVARYHVRPPRWPAGFQLKIAAVADLHACDPWMSLDRIEAIVERTNSLNADVIVLLGDYVAGHRHVTRVIPAAE